MSELKYNGLVPYTFEVYQAYCKLERLKASDYKSLLQFKKLCILNEFQAYDEVAKKLVEKYGTYNVKVF